MSESGASAQITGISAGFIGPLRLSERTDKHRMVCTITIAGVEVLECRELLWLLPMLPAVTNIPTPMSRIPVFPRVPVNPTWS